MSDYEVIGGHEYAEFRQHEDGTIELYSKEEHPETGEDTGTVGFMTQEEFEAVGEALETVEVDGERAETPKLDEMVMGQHPILGSILFIAVGADGERNDDIGAAFGDAQTILDAVESAE